MELFSESRFIFAYTIRSVIALFSHVYNPTIVLTSSICYVNLEVLFYSTYFLLDEYSNERMFLETGIIKYIFMSVYTEKNYLVNFTRYYCNSLTDCPHWQFYKNFFRKIRRFLKKITCFLEKFVGFLEKFKGSLQRITIVHSKNSNVGSLWENYYGTL